jgi:hypothetical protein
MTAAFDICTSCGSQVTADTCARCGAPRVFNHDYPVPGIDDMTISRSRAAQLQAIPGPDIPTEDAGYPGWVGLAPAAFTGYAAPPTYGGYTRDDAPAAYAADPYRAAPPAGNGTTALAHLVLWLGIAVGVWATKSLSERIFQEYPRTESLVINAGIQVAPLVVASMIVARQAAAVLAALALAVGLWVLVYYGWYGGFNVFMEVDPGISFEAAFALNAGIIWATVLAVWLAARQRCAASYWLAVPTWALCSGWTYLLDKTSAGSFGSVEGYVLANRVPCALVVGACGLIAASVSSRPRLSSYQWTGQL